MSSFTWYNLPQEINKLIKPYTDIKVYWYNLPLSLDKVYKEILSLKPSCNTTNKFKWYSLNKKASVIVDLINCVSSNEINFDVTSSDWGSVTDAESFRTYLESTLVTSTISNFSLINGRLRCSLIGNIEQLSLISLNITNINSITIEGLKDLQLSFNQIVDFNPTLPLPNSLEILNLGSNQIVDFNPTISLPEGLKTITLSFNQIVSFNPTLPLPLEFSSLNLQNNQMTSQGYINSEPWASNTLTFVGTNINFSGNIDSVSNTSLESILQSKNAVVIS